MVGFNRRFAPMVEKLKAIPDKRIIQLQKNRIAAQETTEYVIYDLFLHFSWILLFICWMNPSCK